MNSLQKILIRWIVVVTLIISLVAGLSAGVLAFYEAREMQDGILFQIASLIVNQDISSFSDHASLDEEFQDSQIIVQSLGLGDSGPLAVRADLPDGFKTLELNEISWRTYTLSSSDGNKILAAQQTELRDEIAWSSSMSAILPIGILAISLLILVPWLIRYQMKPVIQLSKKVDRQSVDDLGLLSTENIPAEVFPFVEAINRLLNRTRLAIDQQRRFIANASHELRTPVAALSLLSENLLNAPIVEKESRFQLLQNGLDRLASLVDQLLNLARLQSDTRELVEVVAMNTIVEEVVTLFYPLAEKKNIDLGVVEISEIYLDDINNGVKQIVENSISNAINYTPDHGRIDIFLKKKNEMAIFVVLDTGPGIDEADLEKVFIPFHRGEDAGFQGNGLGLAICKEIAQKLKGNIQLRNRSNGGLEFCYTQIVSRQLMHTKATS